MVFRKVLAVVLPPLILAAACGPESDPTAEAEVVTPDTGLLADGDVQLLVGEPASAGESAGSVARNDVDPGSLARTSKATSTKSADTRAPSFDSVPKHSTYSRLTDRTPTISFTANARDTGSGISTGVKGYEASLALDAKAAALAVKWKAVNAGLFQFTGLSLVNGKTYYACLRAVDNAGNRTKAVCSKSGFTVDVTAPAFIPVAIASIGPSALVAEWTYASDDESGIAEYQTSISTGPSHTGRVVSGWAARAEEDLECIRGGLAYPFAYVSAKDCSAIRYTRTGLSLKRGSKYAFNLRSVNEAGTVSEVASDSATVAKAKASPSPSPSPRAS